MLGELSSLSTDEELFAWVKSGLIKKNTLQEADAEIIETTYRDKFGATAATAPARSSDKEEGPSDITADHASHGLPFPKKPVRKRSKAHLLFVSGQPCVVCKQSPCDAHHLKFAQPNALGRTVSDEFTVPLGRTHHHDLHRDGNEKAWWANLQIAPLPIAKELWEASPINLTGDAAAASGAAGIVGSEGAAI